MLGAIKRHPLFSSKLQKENNAESCSQDVEPHPSTFNPTSLGHLDLRIKRTQTLVDGATYF